MKLLLPILLLAVSAQAQPAPTPDPAALVVIARRTAQRFPTTPASWTCSLSVSAGVTLDVDVLQAPPGRRLIFTVKQAQAAPIELARIIQTPTTWYVTQDKRFTKHRPYEAEFDFPVISLALTLAEPHFLTNDDARRLVKFTARDGDLARYAVPPDNPAAIRNLIAQYDEMGKTDPAITNKPETRKTLAGLRTVLEQGVPLAVDTKSGLVAEYATAKLSVKISDFRFIDPAPPLLDPDIARQTWKDFTDDPTVNVNPDDLAMIGHCISWRPGQPSRDFEGLLLNLVTGRTRRIPFAGIAALPGCFVRDRHAVIISGMEIDQANLHLYEIDLKSHVNRRLGGDTLAVGQTMMPALSPAGKTIAALYKNGQGRILDAQVALIDLATGNAKLIGQPLDSAYVNWLPDGKGLILLKRQYSDLKAPADKTICRMDLTGQLTPLCKGDCPLVLKDALLLEQEGEPRTWQIADLQEKNPHPLGDGLPHYAFPTASPDAKRLIMMAINPATGPRPTIIDVDTGKFHPIDIAAGLWAAPAWR